MSSVAAVVSSWIIALLDFVLALQKQQSQLIESLPVDLKLKYMVHSRLLRACLDRKDGNSRRLVPMFLIWFRYSASLSSVTVLVLASSFRIEHI